MELHYFSLCFVLKVIYFLKTNYDNLKVHIEDFRTKKINNRKRNA